MKAINNPLRPSEVAFNGVRSVRGRSVLKTIARKRLRAAERELFRREELPELFAHQAEQRLRRQAVREQATRDVAQLLAGINAAIAAHALEDLAAMPSQQERAQAGTVAGRLLVQQQVVLHQGGRSGPARVLLARASCAV